MKFEALNLRPELLAAVSDLGFKEAMPVQEQVIPLLLEQPTDLIALAQTGTGKTAAFGLPILQQVDTSNRAVEALVLSPTRELCLQIATDMEKMAAHLPGVKIGAVYGGASIERQMSEIERGLKVVVATPGRMLDILRRGKIDLSHIHTVVFDEADEMLHMGFRDELDGILAYTPEEKHTWLFSATMPQEIRAMTGRYMKEPEEITIGRRNEGSANVTHHYYMVQAKERYLALKRIIDYYPEIYSIIFCRTRRETQEVAEKLIQDGYNADALHGDLSQAQRDNAMSRFRLKNLQLLVATDVAARGLDVNNLTHVLNYNLPDDVEQYTHRSGRTGRASATGISIALITPREKSRIKEIEKAINKSFELKQLPSGEAICGKQVLYQAERMLGVDLATEELETYLPAIYEQLQGLSKEELIQRFVALEFNRFLNYYRNAPEVRDMSLDTPREKRQGERGGERGGFVRLFINLGHMDGIKPQNLIGLLNDYVKDRDMRVGRIDLYKTCSFVEIPEAYAELSVKALSGAVYKDRKVFVEIGKGKERGGRDEERGGRRGESRRAENREGGREPREPREPRAGRESREPRADRADRESIRTDRRMRQDIPETKAERRAKKGKKDWMAFIDGSAWEKDEPKGKRSRAAAKAVQAAREAKAAGKQGKSQGRRGRSTQPHRKNKK